MHNQLQERSNRYNDFIDTLATQRNYLPTWKEASASQRVTLLFYGIAISLPVLMVYTIVLTTFILFLTLHIAEILDPMDEKPDIYYFHDKEGEEWYKYFAYIQLGVLAYFLLLFNISFLMTIFTPPGTIPKDDTWKIPTDTLNESIYNLQSERKKDGSARVCFQCGVFKPDRSHHCRLCDCCVLKMDHHCPWVANCIGFYNYKYFFLTVLYGMLSILTFIATFWETLIIKLNDESLSLFYIFPITVHYSLCFMLFIALMGFLIFHLYLIFSGYSTIEYCEKKTKRVTYVGKSPYNLSCFANLKEALGERWLLWLLPIKYRTDKEDGLQFTVNQPEIIEKEDSEI